MNVVAENHAESLGRPGGRSQDALIAAVIGEGLRDAFDQERGELPDALRNLLISLEDKRPDRMAAS